jgi:hypothetical protein
MAAAMFGQQTLRVPPRCGGVPYGDCRRHASRPIRAVKFTACTPVRRTIGADRNRHKVMMVRRALRAEWTGFARLCNIRAPMPECREKTFNYFLTVAKNGCYRSCKKDRGRLAWVGNVKLLQNIRQTVSDGQSARTGTKRLGCIGFRNRPLVRVLRSAADVSFSKALHEPFRSEVLTSSKRCY